VQPAFASGEAGGLITYIRNGWANPDGTPRASLQRVTLRLKEGRLERVSAPYLDGPEPDDIMVLATGIAQVSMTFRHKGQWLDRWQVTGPTSLPDAFDLTLKRSNGITTRHVFSVGTRFP
jgi:general secretion pathway protein J